MYSENVVGYTKVSLPAGFFLAGANFKQVGTNEESIWFTDLVSGNFNAGDEVQFFDSAVGGYVTLRYYVGTLADTTTIPPQFGLTGWGTTLGTKSDHEITAGTGFWIKSNAASVEQTQAGEVVSTESPLAIYPAGFSLVATKYPKDYFLSELILNGISSGDEVQFFDSESGSYMTLRYYVGTLADTTTIPPQFGLTGWGTPLGNKSDCEIKLGTGFWLKAQSPVTVEFPPPLL